MIMLYNTIASSYIAIIMISNTKVSVYCIEGLPATCAGSQEVN